MKNAIYKRVVNNTDLAIRQVFTAPRRITFGIQPSTKTMNIWFNSSDAADTAYVILPTGDPFETEIELVSTLCLDGYHIFHLCRVL